jgi:hypothetical protein
MRSTHGIQAITLDGAGDRLASPFGIFLYSLQLRLAQVPVANRGAGKTIQEGSLDSEV